MRQPRDWYTSVQDNTIRKMKRLGFSPVEIGEKLDRTEWSIRERARLIGVPWQQEPGTSILVNKSTPDMNAERVAEMNQRAGDRKLVRELAKAIQRGDHLPQGTVVPLRLIG
jgi:hypothetical protein